VPRTALRRIAIRHICKSPRCDTLPARRQGFASKAGQAISMRIMKPVTCRVVACRLRQAEANQMRQAGQAISMRIMKRVTCRVVTVFCLTKLLGLLLFLLFFFSNKIIRIVLLLFFLNAVLSIHLAHLSLGSLCFY
jgi:hypothetical protein